MNTTTKADLNFSKSGTVIQKGTTLEVFFDSKNNSRVYLDPPSVPSRRIIRLASAGKYLTGFNKIPTLTTLEKWNDSGVCKTPTGHKVEPDGYGPDGSPSWLLVLGVI